MLKLSKQGNQNFRQTGGNLTSILMGMIFCFNRQILLHSTLRCFSVTATAKLKEKVPLLMRGAGYHTKLEEIEINLQSQAAPQRYHNLPLRSLKRDTAMLSYVIKSTR